MSDVEERLDYLVQRLQTAYESLGHSSGRPYVYFVYPPDQERAVRRLAAENLRSDSSLSVSTIDLLPLTIASLAGQEERREQLLNDPAKSAGTANSIIRIWARALARRIAASLAEGGPVERPVVVLLGVAALHPIGNPTQLMEGLAEQEPRNPATGKVVPIVLFVPGIRPPQTSRRYLFLGLERLALDFYRGEEA